MRHAFLDWMPWWEIVLCQALAFGIFSIFVRLCCWLGAAIDRWSMSEQDKAKKIIESSAPEADFLQGREVRPTQGKLF